MDARGDAPHLVRAGGAGIVFAAGQADSLGRAVDTLLAKQYSARERMGLAGRAYYEAHVPMAAGVQAFEEEFMRTNGIESCPPD